ncbi:MAG: PAS domain-containing protein [Devosia sp.]
MRQVELIVRHGAELLRMAQASFPVGVWTWGPGDAGLFWSDALYQIFGLDRATLPMTPERFVAMVHPDDRYLFADWHKIATREWLLGQTCRVVRADGAARVLHIRGEANRNAAGQLEVYGTIADVTDGANLGPEDVSEISSSQVRAARAWLDWTAQDLADHSGVSFSTVRRIEAPGPRAVRGANVNAIRRALAQHGVRFVRFADGTTGVVGR